MNIVCLEDHDGDYALSVNIINRNIPTANIAHFRYLNDFLKSPTPYDLIITDLSLPDAYGPEVIYQIRKITGKPIIVLSGVGGSELPERIIRIIKNSGATIHLSKHKKGYQKLPEIIKQLI